MDPKEPRTRPEDKLSAEMQMFLRARGWFVKKTHGNIFSSGWPDLYCAHKRYGARWVELKIKDHGRLTEAQHDVFPEFAAAKIGIWILTAATMEEYDKMLTKPPNWWLFK